MIKKNRVALKYWRKSRRDLVVHLARHNYDLLNVNAIRHSRSICLKILQYKIIL